MRDERMEASDIPYAAVVFGWCVWLITVRLTPDQTQKVKKTLPKHAVIIVPLIGFSGITLSEIFMSLFQRPLEEDWWQS